MFDRYKFEYAWINNLGRLEIEYIWVQACSEEEARTIIKRMCTDPDLTFRFMYSVETP